MLTTDRSTQSTERTAQGAVDRPIYTRAQLDRLIAPKSIAIVGASPRAGSFGLRTLENLANFRGAIWPVNAKYPKIGAHECFPSLAALPGKPDLVALVVPREGVEAALREAAAVGAGGVVVYASGYGEMAREDAGVAQRRLSDIARAAGMPLLGPNCMGLVNHALDLGKCLGRLHPIVADALEAFGHRMLHHPANKRIDINGFVFHPLGTVSG